MKSRNEVNNFSSAIIEEKLRNILIDSLPAQIFWKDLRLIYLGCNQSFLNSLGLSKKEEVIGKSDFDLPVSPEDSVAYRADDMAVISSKKAKLQIEERQILQDGTERYLSTSKVPLLDENNEVYGILGIYIDITERKKMEDDLRIAKEKAELASQAKDDFISDMEHDLRTPFNGIGGMADLLYAMSEEKYPELRDLLEIMTKSCARWEEVQNRIFNVLSVEKTKAVQIKPTSIGHELMKIKEMQAATLHMRKLLLVIEPIPDDIDIINTDPLRLHLILLSFTSNAINFTEQGEIKVKVAHEGGFCVIQVMDTGIGIPTDKFEYIFEKFTKLSRSNKHGGNFKGVGLGLYTARSYAMQLGATIHVDSQLGKGSTFYLQLPIREE